MARLFLLASMALALACGESRFPFGIAEPAEVVATLTMSSPGSDWAVPGREAAVARVLLNGKEHQHVMLFAGAARYGYRISLGYLPAGKHELLVERDSRHSAAGSQLEADDLRIAVYAKDEPVYAYAPVLYARLNTIGAFSDVPLLLYCERLREGDEEILQYTVIFSNEDGGTSSRALMSRWGRTTDIEYVYRRSMTSGKAIVQGPNHVDTEFQGAHDRGHPLLMPVTNNNMIAAAKDSPLQFRLAPILVDLSNSSREQVMDDHPVTYTVMTKELEREARLRPFGSVDGEKISDPRNYLFADYTATLTNGALTVLVTLKDGSVYASDLGRGDIAIARNGAVRTTVELPPGTTRSGIATIGFECRVPPGSRNAPLAHSGTCVLQGVSKVFQLRQDSTPGESFWSMEKLVTLATGRGVSYVP